MAAHWPRGRGQLLPILLIVLTIPFRAIAAQSDGPTPLITASVNESTQAELYRGWPLLLEVGLLHPEPFAASVEPVLIDMGSGPWSGAVRVQIINTNDQPQAWPFTLFNVTSNALTLDRSVAGQLLYYLRPEQTTLLTAGSYTIQAFLNTTNSTNPQAWKGVVDSVPVELTLLDAPATLTPEQREAKQQLLASYHLFRDDAAQANAAIDTLLTAAPSSIAGLSFKSYLLELAGQTAQAEQLLSTAIDIVYSSFPNAEEPPFELIRRRNQLLRQSAGIIIRSITLQSQSLTLLWDASPGEEYTVETSSDLISWTPIATDLVADSQRLQWTTPATQQARFFRLRK